MNKVLKYAPLCLAVLFASCSGDEPAATVVGNAARVSGTIGDSRTRASGTSWEPGDSIGVTGAGYINIRYVTADGSGNFSSDGKKFGRGIFFTDMEEHTFSAYYPCRRSSIAIKTNDQRQRKSFDFLYATGAKASSGSPEVRFTGDAAFRHCMSRLTFSIRPDVDSGITSLDGCTEVTLGNIKWVGFFDDSTGSTTTIDDIGSIPLIDVMQTDGSGGMNGEAIIFPQEGKFTLSLTVDGKHFSCPLSASSSRYDGGTSYAYIIKVANAGLRVEGSTITDWTEIPMGEITAVRVLDVADYDGSPIANDCTLIGTTERTITLADGVKVTFQDLTANNGVRCSGNADIYLKGVNEVKNTLAVGPKGTTMTIDGDADAVLRATNGDVYAAAFGMTNRQSNGGSIIINGGRIEAVSDGYSFTAIGSCGDITPNGYICRLDAIIINGGVVNALALGSIAIGGAVGKIEINGGYVEARSEGNYPGIGAAAKHTCVVDLISITGGTVKAWGGDSAPGIGGSPPGIGSSYLNRVEISGGDVTVEGGSAAPAIGLNVAMSGIEIVISGGNIKAKIHPRAPVCIGVEYDPSKSSSVKVTGGELTIDRSEDPLAPYFSPAPNPYTPDSEAEEYAPRTEPSEQ